MHFRAIPHMVNSINNDIVLLYMRNHKYNYNTSVSCPIEDK